MRTLRENFSPQPFWWEAAPRPRRAAPLPSIAEIVVVGGGFTGLSAALTLARAGREVLVLEAEDVGAGASSRNGGMIGSGHRVGFARASALYGADLARALLGEGLKALAFTTALIENEGLNCDFERCGRFRGAWRAADYEAMAEEAEVMQREVGLVTEMVSRADTLQDVGHKRYHGGCRFPHHGGLHPGKLVNELLRLAETAGARVFTQAPVLSIEADGPGKRLVTPRGTLWARQVIIASNGYTRPGTPYFTKRIVPVPSYLIATEEIGETRVKALIPGGRMIVETRSRHCYYRASPDGKRIILGARASLAPLPPARSGAILKRLLDNLFPTMKEVKVTHSWSGLTGMSRDELPHLGQHEGLYFALGYSGSGVAMAPYLGHKIALRLLGDGEGESPFAQTPHPTVPFYNGRPWFLRAMEAYHHFKDRREGSL